MSNEGLSELEAIYDALDSDDPGRALELARDELNRHGDDPVLHFLAGMARLAQDLPGDAAGHLATAVELDPEDAEFRARLALALYHGGRLDEAREQAEAALSLDQALPEAHDVRGLLHELDGEPDEADRCFNRAHELEPESFPLATRLSPDAFAARVAEAGERLPEAFRRHLDDVTLSVEPVPPRELVEAETPPLDPSLLGLFVGVALPERSHFSAGGELPPRIYLFQRNLERYSVDGDDLVEQIAVTVYHELGHYLGLDEEELIGIDLG
jgi:predicted Zn-dependent protease with MMP-like domain